MLCYLFTQTGTFKLLFNWVYYFWQLEFSICEVFGNVSGLPLATTFQCLPRKATVQTSPSPSRLYANILSFFFFFLLLFHATQAENMKFYWVLALLVCGIVHCTSESLEVEGKTSRLNWFLWKIRWCLVRVPCIISLCQRTGHWKALSCGRPVTTRKTSKTNWK